MPAEQLVNLYQDTVGSGGYVAGSLTLTVSSGSGAPPSGPFTVTILNSAGTAILLLFRVTSLVGPVFTGAAEGPDVNAPAGSIVIGSTLSVAAINNLFAASGGGFIQPLTAPVSGSLSDFNFNTGTGVVTNQYNNTSPATSITLTQNDPNNTEELAAIGKAKLAAAFTLTIGFSALGLSPQGIAGLWLYDGSANMILFGYQVGFGIRAAVFSNFSTFSGDVFTVQATWPFPQGPLVWVRIQETVSARNYSVSSDGINFTEIFTESNTAHFTTSDYGFGAEPRSGSSSFLLMGITCYSFVETNP